MAEYENAGAIIQEDLSPASLIMAVKQVRRNPLIIVTTQWSKKYSFVLSKCQNYIKITKNFSIKKKNLKNIVKSLKCLILFYSPLNEFRKIYGKKMLL